jgi:hypothetical protein
MKLRFYRDPETDEPHIYGHNVDEEEVEEVLRGPGEDRPGRRSSRIAIGKTGNGCYLRVIYVPDPEPDSVFVITAYDLTGKTLDGLSKKTPQEGTAMKRKQQFPAGWDEARVRDVIEHYEAQTEEEAVAEDEAAFEDPKQTVMEVPRELVPAIRELIAKHRAA